MRLLFNCKQAHQIVSEGLDRDLRFSERARLKLHLSICDSCSNFYGQMRLLRQAMRHFPLGQDNPGEDKKP